MENSVSDVIFVILYIYIIKVILFLEKFVVKLNKR